MVCPHCLNETAGDLGICTACRGVLPPDPDVTVAADRTAASLAPDDATIANGGAQGAGPSGSFAPGSLFAGRYRIERLLGAGGMGAVYQAWDSELSVSIALKVIRSDITADPEAARDFERRFKQELLLARQVSHPNVVRIHDLGDAAGVKYITMSYVVGSDLCAVLKSGALPIERARHLALQLASGIAAAHDAGIAHRDLKPQNILIDSHDQLYISDFGLAKSLEATTAGLTRTGELLGTPRYISPEQVEGKPVDRRADLYAVGLILYEMVSGEAPFAGPSAIELMLQRIKDQPKPVRRANPNVPDYLERIIMRCLERDPNLRYQNAHEIVADLKAEHATASTVSDSRRSVSLTLPVPRSRAWPIAAAVLVILAVLLAMPATRRKILPAGDAGGQSTSAAAAVRIAVVPFAAPADAPALADIAAGVDEALVAKLFQIRNVTVASAAAVRRAASRKSVDLIGREVGANLIVTGTVQRAGDRVQITATLDDLSGRGRVWSQDFSGVPADLLTLQDQVFTALVGQLNLTPSSAERAGTMTQPTASIDAYTAYLKGRRAMRDEQKIDNVKAAIGHYRDALALDPRFALAYTGLADSSIRMYRETRDEAFADQALSAALHAQSIDDGLAEVHISLGNAYQATGKTNEAIVELKRAADLAPSSDEAYRRLGRAYMSGDRADEAIEAYKKALAINEYHWVNSNSLGIAYAQLARYDDAIVALKRVIDLAPDNVNGYNDLGAIYLQTGRYDEAIAVFQKALAVQPIADTYSNLAIAYTQSGRFADAVPAFEKAAELEPNSEMFAGNLGDGYRWAGQDDKAAAAYDNAIALALKDLQVNPRAAGTKASLALYYAKKGNAAPARRFIGEARAIDKRTVELMYSEAVVWALLKDTDRALASLEEAIKSGYPVAAADGDPDLRGVRSDPRYAALKTRLSQPASK